MLPGFWEIMVVRTNLVSVNHERFVMSRYGLPMGQSIRICYCELHAVTESVDGYGRPLRPAHLRVSLYLK
jgi:hypothetical protein